VDSISGISYYLNKCQTLSNTSHMTFFSFRKTAHGIGAHALCMQHSRTAVALSTSFLLNHAPNSPELNALTARFGELYGSVSMSRESKRLNKSSSNWLNSGNALIQHLSKNASFVFPRFDR